MIQKTAKRAAVVLAEERVGEVVAMRTEAEDTVSAPPAAGETHYHGHILLN
jgi:hypothetical protein